MPGKENINVKRIGDDHEINNEDVRTKDGETDLLTSKEWKEKKEGEENETIKEHKEALDELKDELDELKNDDVADDDQETDINDLNEKITAKKEAVTGAIADDIALDFYVDEITNGETTEKVIFAHNPEGEDYKWEIISPADVFDEDGKFLDDIEKYYEETYGLSEELELEKKEVDFAGEVDDLKGVVENGENTEESEEELGELKGIKDLIDKEPTTKLGKRIRKIFLKFGAIVGPSITAVFTMLGLTKFAKVGEYLHEKAAEEGLIEQSDTDKETDESDETLPTDSFEFPKEYAKLLEKEGYNPNKGLFPADYSKNKSKYLEKSGIYENHIDDTALNNALSAETFDNQKVAKLIQPTVDELTNGVDKASHDLTKFFLAKMQGGNAETYRKYKTLFHTGNLSQWEGGVSKEKVGGNKYPYIPDWNNGLIIAYNNVDINFGIKGAKGIKDHLTEEEQEIFDNIDLQGDKSNN